jgi:hypothetical protein
MPDIIKPDRTIVMPDVDLAASRDSPDAIVSAKRRRLAKFALGAPVLVTLASRPVLAGQCLSNILSGNLSHPDPGNCSTGLSPGAWGMPGGNIQTYSTVGAWSAVGLSYGAYTPEKSVPKHGKMQSTAVGLNEGDYTPAICSPSNPNKYDCYAGGATLANVPAILNRGGLPTTTLLREVLTAPQLDQLTRHLICAYLNALLGALPGSSFMYVLTPQQVLDLASGAIPLPTGYSGLNDFLDSTWT